MQDFQKVSSKSDIHEKYLEFARDITSVFTDPRILKLDCHNEVYSRPIDGGIALNVKGNVIVLEADLKEIIKCREQTPGINVIEGDMRDIPFKTNYFDCILDLSTLDHIRPSEVAHTLGEYARVLKKGGRILLCVWYGKTKEIFKENAKDWDATYQYYFKRKDVEKYLKIFKTDVSGILYEEDHRVMYFYYLR